MHLFFFDDTPTTEIYTLSLHDALPISRERARAPRLARRRHGGTARTRARARTRESPLRARARIRADRKSTRLNSSHPSISYAVFCLKKKKLQTRFLEAR